MLAELEGLLAALRDQCAAAGVPYFMKQSGARPFDGTIALMLGDSHGGDLDEFPHDLRVRQFPVPR